MAAVVAWGGQARSAPLPNDARTILAAPSGATLTALHADGDGVYVGGVTASADGSGQGFVRRLSADGQVNETIWEGDGTPFIIRSGTDSLVFATQPSGDGQPEVLRRQMKRGRALSDVTTFAGHSKLASIVVAGSSIYYAAVIDNTTSGEGEIGVLSAANERRVLISGVPVGPLVLSRHSLDWIGAGSLYRLARPETTPVVLATFGGALADVAADASDVYVTLSDRVARFHDGQVSTVAAQQLPEHLLADSERLYWAETAGPDAPRLVEARRADGFLTVIVTNVRSIAALAQDRSHVYWLDPAAGTVSSVAK